MKYRNEWKYLCNNNDLIQIENKLDKVLKLDSHTDKNNKYIIHSLYFDDFNNSCILDNDAGLGKRYKYRIRYYNDDKDYIVLERKEKYNNLGIKKSCQLTLQEYENIVNGDISSVFWNTNNELLKKFCVDVQTRLFKPKVIIDYERTAYVEPITNVRITFDRNISGSTQISNFLDKDYTRYPLLEPNMHILEIKFDDILPSHIRQATHINALQQTTFSKYYLSRNILERD